MSTIDDDFEQLLNTIADALNSAKKEAVPLESLLGRPICSCGHTLGQALDAAKRSAEQMLTHDCFMWYLTVKMLESGMAKLLLEQNPQLIRQLLALGLGPEHEAELGDILVDILKKTKGE